MRSPSHPDSPPVFQPDVHAFAWIFAISAAVLALGFVPLRSSYDEWWHLKSGRYIAENGLPKNDVFTYTAEQIPWHNHEWLSQILLWKIFESGEARGAGGIRTIQAVKCAFLMLSYLGLAVWLSGITGRPALAGLAVMIGFAMSRRTMLYFRPPFLTSGLLILCIILLMRWRIGGKRRPLPLFVLPPVFAVWANLHGGFMAGLVFVGAFWAETLMDVVLAWWRGEATRDARRALAWVNGILGACVVATLANPYGWRLYELAARVMGDKELVALIFELLPPDWNFVWIVDALIVLLVFTVLRPASRRGLAWAVGVAVGVLWLSQTLTRGAESRLDQMIAGAWVREIVVVLLLTANALRASGRIGCALWLLNLFFAHQAIQHVRHLPLWGIVAAPFIALCLLDWLAGPAERLVESRSGEQARGRLSRQMPSFATALTTGFALFYLLFPGEVISSVRAAIRSPLEFLGEPLAGSNLGRNIELIRGTELQAGSYPVEAVDHLIASGAPGRIWNAANYAGYLIWRLSPEKHKVFTDTRYDIWGGKFLTQEIIVSDGFEGDPGRPELPTWSTVLDHWGVNTLILPVGAGLHGLLKARMDAAGAAWRLDYMDPQWAIWIRKSRITPKVEVAEER